MSGHSTTPVRISVVLVTYNHGGFIRQAIDSVLQQDRLDLELIVVDDGSTDDTPGILSTYGERLHVHRQVNAGEAAARNRGLELARGCYLLFLDSDDVLLPGGLAHLAAMLDDEPELGVVYSDGWYCDTELRSITRLSDRRRANHVGDVFEPMALSSFVGALHCAMLRSSIISGHGLRFDEGMVIGPDWDFWIQLASRTHFGYLDRETCLYRIHGRNITSTTAAVQRAESLQRNRLKLLESALFMRLSLDAREHVLQDLLLTKAKRQPDLQQKVLGGRGFASLAADSRARILSLLAADAILERDGERAMELLDTARGSVGLDWRGRVLCVLARAPSAFSAGLLESSRYLRAWRRSGASDPDPVRAAFGLGQSGRTKD